MAIARAFTIADLDNFPDDGRRYEIIDGELYGSAAPHFDHQLFIDRLAAAFERWDPDNTHGVAASGAGVIFAVDTGVIPDLVWVAATQAAILLDPATGERDGKLYGAPALAVEVLSPGAANIARDRDTKLKLYARREVGEY
jgi:Uma2 family endonuclease